VSDNAQRKSNAQSAKNAPRTATTPTRAPDERSDRALFTTAAAVEEGALVGVEEGVDELDELPTALTAA
jgi:hypothetical protein